MGNTAFSSSFMDHKLQKVIRAITNSESKAQAKLLNKNKTYQNSMIFHKLVIANIFMYLMIQWRLAVARLCYSRNGHVHH